MSPPWGYFHAGSSNLLSEFIHHHVLMLHMTVSDCWMGRWGTSPSEASKRHRQPEGRCRIDPSGSRRLFHTSIVFFNTDTTKKEIMYAASMKLIQLWKLHPCSSRPRTAIRCVDGGYVLVAFVCMCCDCAETESAVGADSNGGRITHHLTSFPFHESEGFSHFFAFLAPQTPL